MSDGNLERRKIVIGILPYMLNAYLEAQRYLNPTSIALKALDDYDAGIRNEQENLKNVLKHIKDVQLSFEDGCVSVHLDRESTLEMVGSYLRKKFALQGATTSRLSPAPSFGFKPDSGMFDAELRLPNRSIFVKFLEAPNITDEVKLYTEKAKSMNPSEVWLFGANTEKVETLFDPVFRENSILRGKFKQLDVSEVFGELVGNKYQVVARDDKSKQGGFVFLVRNLQKQPTGNQGSIRSA